MQARTREVLDRLETPLDSRTRTADIAVPEKLMVAIAKALSRSSFIVTLGSMVIFRSLVTWLADGGTLSVDFALGSLYEPVY